jgi:MYXO-CTERM domain-containing protein
MKTLRPVLVAAGLLAGGLALASPALACPGNKGKADHAQAMAAHAEASPSSECGYAARQRSQSCCGSSFGTKVLAAGVPAGLVAFGLGWLTGGRRRRENKPQA